MIYNKIYDFCKVRNNGNCFSNGTEPTPRVKFLMQLLESEGIEYELDTFESNSDRRRAFIDIPGIRMPENKYFNIIMRGTSNKMVVAHHDVNNAKTDNANDNSASVINVIATKKLRPEINAVLLDGEELGGIGSNRLSTQINAGDFGNIEWVLNYELTGKGGKYFFIGDYPGKLTDRIKSIFNCPVVRTPFNDSVIFRKNGIDSTVINPLPPLPQGKIPRHREDEVIFPDGTSLDKSILYHCHSTEDTLKNISTSDMKEFIEEVVLKII